MLARAALAKESPSREALRQCPKLKRSEHSSDVHDLENGCASSNYGWDFSSVSVAAHGERDQFTPVGRRPMQAAGFPIQAKLQIGAVNDPLEREADDVAEQVMRIPGPVFARTTAGDRVVRRKCAECEQEDEEQKKISRKVSGNAAALDATAAPRIVHEVLRSPGRPLDAETRQFFEPRFGCDFSKVRVHSDARSGESARAVNALAYTIGPHVVLRDGGHQVAGAAGRSLLAHELAHVVQQANVDSATAGALPISHPGDAAERAADSAAHRVTAGLPVPPATASSPAVARQVPGQQVRDPDPGCPPDKPYRIAPKTGPGEADPAVVPVCSAVPIPTTPKTPNLLAPDTGGGGKQPAEPEPKAPVAQPGQPTEPTQPAPRDRTEQPQPAPEEKEKKTGEGYEFSDDPLADYGGSSAIRVRPGPVRTTLIRPRPAPASVVKPPITDCGSLFGFQAIAQFGGKKFGPWDGAAVAKTAEATFQACPLAYVSIAVREKSTGDDPHAEAVERAVNLENDLVKRIGPNKYTPDHYYSGSMSPSADPDDAEIEVDLASRGKVSYGAGESAGGKAATPSNPNAPTTQISGQAGVGGVQHIYTTPAGPNDALREFVLQTQVAITKQLHAKNQSGLEKQLFVQAQYSFTTKQWTIAVGGQVAQVFQLTDDLQASFFAQLQQGANVNTGQGQTAAAAGAQLQWQPKDWFSVVGQGTGGPVTQSGGPSSVDLGFTISIQIQK